MNEQEQYGAAGTGQGGTGPAQIAKEPSGRAGVREGSTGLVACFMCMFRSERDQFERKKQ